MDSSYFAPGVGGSSVSAALNDLTDVNAPSPGDGDALVYDDNAGEWVAGQVAGGDPFAGVFERQTAVPGSYHFPRGGTLGQQAPFGSTMVPIAFDANTTITKLGTRIAFNVPQQFGGDPNGFYIWLAVYEGEDGTGFPKTLVAASGRFTVVGQGQGTPQGAFTNFTGPIVFELSEAVELTGGVQYWIGIIGAYAGESPSGQQPQLIAYEPVGIGPNITGTTGMPETMLEFFDSVGSVFIQGAVEDTGFDFDTDPVPAELSTATMSPHGVGCTAAVLVQGV